MPPWLCYATLPQQLRHTTSAHFTDVCWPLWPKHTIPWNTIKQGLLQPQGELCPNQSIFNHCSQDQLLKFRMSFETISSEFLVQGNVKHTKFSREHLYRSEPSIVPLIFQLKQNENWGWDYDGIYSNLLTLWCDNLWREIIHGFHKLKACLLSCSKNNNMIMIHLSRWD